MTGGSLAERWELHQPCPHEFLRINRLSRPNSIRPTPTIRGIQYSGTRATLAASLLVCKESGTQYIGSAKGEESLLARFMDYAKTGHGGNLELKRRGRKAYQVSVLEIVNSDVDIEGLEAAWKRRLLSRTFGLNEN